MLRREFRQKVGGRLPDALAQAAGRRLELPGLHLRGDRPGLGEGGFAGLHGEYRLQGRGRPIPVVGRHLREHVAHEVHHAPLVLRPGKHRVHRGDESRAPVADHEAHALQTAFDHASYELLPAGSVLPHALRHADDLAVALRVDADGDEDADVLHASAPGALVPHAVHEHVRVFGFQWPGAPSVDVVIHALELVGKGLGWHPVTPQQFADVVDLTGAHSRQAHLHQRLLDAGLPPAVAFDDRGFEDRALEFRHPELEPARLCRERAFVVAGPVRLAPLLAFVSGGPGDLVGLGVEHGVEDLGHLLGDQPVEFGLEQVLVDLYDVAVGHGCASCFPIAILCLATENRTQDAGHARFNISTKNKTESAQEFGRYPGAQYNKQQIIDRLTSQARALLNQHPDCPGVLAANGGLICPFGPCMAFVWYIFHSAGLDIFLCDGAKTGWPHHNYDWYRSRGRVSHTPHVGDIAFWKFGDAWAHDYDASHAGVVVEVNGRNVIIIDAAYGDIGIRSAYNGANYAHPYYDE